MYIEARQERLLKKLADKRTEQVKILVEQEWAKLQPLLPKPPAEPPGIVWSYRVSPAFPSLWPPGAQIRLHYYAYAEGFDISGGLADGVHLAAPWGRIDAPCGPGETTPEFLLLSPEMRPIGVQGVGFLSEAGAALYARQAQVEAYLASLISLPPHDAPQARELVAFYRTWCQHNGVAEQIRPHHREFFAWLDRESRNSM